MPEEFSAGAVVARVAGSEQLYLLLHYSAGHWDFPKGHIEEGESEQETARREILEETGIGDIKFDPAFSESTEYYYRQGKKLMRKKVIFFLAKTETEKVTVSFEHRGYEWLPFEKAKERVTFANSRKVLEKAHGHLSGGHI